MSSEHQKRTYLCRARFYLDEDDSDPTPQCLFVVRGNYCNNITQHSIKQCPRRCGHVKLGDMGSCGRLAEGASGAPAVATADYAAPELLAAAACASRHTVCLEYCRGIVTSAIVGSHDKRTLLITLHTLCE